MRSSIYISKLLAVTKQRDVLLPMCAILSVTQLLTLGFLFFKKERVILIPPVVNQPMWIDGYAVSPTYLEQMGVFLGQTLLSNSVQSLQAGRDMLLRFVHPSVYTHFRQHLIEEEAHLQKQQGSYHFHVCSVTVDPGTNSVLLEGDRASYIGDRRIDQAREKYRLTFAFSHGRYLLTGCTKESA